jgi:hypothetical protein
MAVTQAPLGGQVNNEDDDGPDETGTLASYLKGGPEGAALALMQKRAAAQSAAQQQMLGTLQQQEGALGQAGMSDYDKASLLFQAAGALGQTTRSGGFGETLGNVGTALAGPLSKAAEAQRQRQQQLQQLQLARQKLAVEMAGTGVSAQDMMSLIKSQRENEEEKPTPSEFERVIGQLTPEERAKAIRVKAGLETAAGKEKAKDVSDKTLSDFADAGETLTNLDDLTKRFKPDFAGKWLETGAEAQNLAGRKGFSEKYKDQAQWWSDYAERRNVLRNTLFGSAVTKGEAAEFLKADITPGMDPDLVQKKLERQKKVALAAAYKLAKAKELQGFDVAPIEAAIGYKIKDLEKNAKELLPPSGQQPAASAQPAPGAQRQASPVTAPTQHPQAEAALAWARANPSDPRAAAILQRLGVQ